MTKAPRQRLDKPALFEAVRYKPHAGQMLVHRSKAPRRVLACGVRWGKTLCAAMEAVAALLQPSEETLGWTVAPTLELSELVFKRVVATMEAHFKARIKFCSPRERRLVVVNFSGGLSELRGKSADAPDSLLGEGLDFLIVDEAARMKAEVWEGHLSQRLIDKKGWALLISTPGDRGWFWRVFRRGLKNRDAAFESWTSASWENPYLSRELIEEDRRRLPKGTFESQYGGEFLGFDTGPCDLCGAPDPNVPSILFADGKCEHLTCADCGWRVDTSGHTLVTRFDDNGLPNQIVVIVFENRPNGDPALPETCHDPLFPQRCQPAVGDSGGVPRPDGEIEFER